MMKYAPLRRHLATLVKDEWLASFAQVEQILGFALPASARKYPAWWANQAGPGHSQSQAWEAAGWRTGDIDLAARCVRFRRIRRSDGYALAERTDAGESDRLFEEASEFLGIADREELIREGVKALIEREAARQLAAFGGGMPDFSAPPRRRGE